jgi:hypothetical protein
MTILKSGFGNEASFFVYPSAELVLSGVEALREITIPSLKISHFSFIH